MFEVDRNSKLEAQVFKVMPLHAHPERGWKKFTQKESVIHNLLPFPTNYFSVLLYIA
jgi:hypothetical protein